MEVAEVHVLSTLRSLSTAVRSTPASSALPAEKIPGKRKLVEKSFFKTENAIQPAERVLRRRTDDRDGNERQPRGDEQPEEKNVRTPPSSPWRQEEALPIELVNVEVLAKNAVLSLSRIPR